MARPGQHTKNATYQHGTEQTTAVSLCISCQVMAHAGMHIRGFRYGNSTHLEGLNNTATQVHNYWQWLDIQSQNNTSYTIQLCITCLAVFCFDASSPTPHKSAEPNGKMCIDFWGCTRPPYPLVIFLCKVDLLPTSAICMSGQQPATKLAGF